MNQSGRNPYFHLDSLKQTLSHSARWLSDPLCIKNGGNMNTNDNQKHNENIINQFTKQAIPFSELPGHMDSIQMLIEMSKVTNKDLVLDVACGPGMVACEFAKIAHHVTGIDITEKMIEQAKKRQQEMNLNNLSWDIGTVLPLPYEDETFSVVVTRYSFHHFIDAQDVLNEMCRVCKKNGTILIADPVLPKENVEFYNKMEKLRDPSHTQALSIEAFDQVMKKSGLLNLKRGGYKVTIELEKQLKASFPNPGDEEKIRNMIKNDIGINAIGVDARLSENEVYITYPISIYVGNKNA